MNVQVLLFTRVVPFDLVNGEKARHFIGLRVYIYIEAATECNIAGLRGEYSIVQ